MAMTTSVDKRADFAAILSHPVRRRIRDELRINGNLTLTEIARNIGHSEQNTYHHLNRMLQVGLVTKRVEKIDGRFVTLYSLSEDYEEVFGDQKPDIRPIYFLFGVYVALTVIAYAYPPLVSSIFWWVKPASVKLILLGGLSFAALIIAYYQFVENVILALRRFLQ